MSNLTKITDDLWAVEVPTDARKFRINTIQNELGINFYQMYYEYNITNISKDIKGVILDFSNVEILGTVSETEMINFDVTPYLTQGEIHACIKHSNEEYYFNKCFRSLLKSKGITQTPETKIVILKKI